MFRALRVVAVIGTLTYLSPLRQEGDGLRLEDVLAWGAAASPPRPAPPARSRLAEPARAGPAGAPRQARGGVCRGAVPAGAERHAPPRRPAATLARDLRRETLTPLPLRCGMPYMAVEESSCCRPSTKSSPISRSWRISTDRLEYLIELGRLAEPLPPEEKTEANRVRGCASQVWLDTRIEPAPGGPVLHFHGDSDAIITRGIVALIAALYSGHRADEVSAASTP